MQDTAEENTKSWLIEKTSEHSVVETLDKLEEMARSKGMKVFARIDHAAAAMAVGLKMRPTEVLIFGDPRNGTPLMIQHPVLALDMPFRALAWEDESGQVHVAYNSSQYFQKRYSFQKSPFDPISDLIEKSSE